ncbi:FecCD family ABC transporter permease [Chitinophaga pinensis]|uniref:Transport system permease protein n=1 Tax=Chitinophaga pinensis (strain ATCC 43595 / DSM 2588 / LMG 13176 / NBRC 15968 / NCIMB 11800 / UQM 2034) TaxID=485918 RepID=A0A979GXG8_CHIPD|nr:iron ABC transporter permease [Chitinophaga pinensis]ACU64623.1 transport system permease protein [Chitinophaga pinensis DSM 2588]
MSINIKRAGSITILSVLLIVVILLATGTGAMHMSPIQVLAILLEKTGIHLPVAYEENMPGVLWMIRLPRVVLSVLIGAGLGLAGASLQGLLRNPLADPGLIGISSGASMGAVVMIIVQHTLPVFQSAPALNFYALNLAAFAGAIITTLFIFRIARTGGQAVISTLLLAGIAVRALCESVTGLMTYLANNEQLRSITFWSLGSLGGANWKTVAGIAPFIIIPLIVLPRLAPALNLLALGEREAMHSGVGVPKLKALLVILATMAVAAGVAVAGIIGFIGLIVPHIVRQFTGPDYRILIPGSALSGAVLLTVADLLCRTIVAPAELPVGIITAVIGAPFFLWLIIKEKRTILA